MVGKCGQCGILTEVLLRGPSFFSFSHWEKVARSAG
jgi:hypothetical protein